MSIASPASDLRKLRLCLFAGLLCIFLAFWKGEGGISDLKEYLDDATSLWLKGDMSLPIDETRQAELRSYLLIPDLEPDIRAAIEDDLRRQYNRYSIGLAAISGPTVLAGAALEKLTGGLVSARSVGPLIVPLLAALACLLIFETGLLLRLSARVSIWAALVFGLGSTLFTYMRLFYTEVAVTFFVIAGVWAFLRARESLSTPGKGRRGHPSHKWLLLCGAALAGITACHYGDMTMSPVLWSAFALAVLLQKQTFAAKVHQIATLSVVPALAAGGILWLHYWRYGSFSAGGYSFDVENLFSLRWLPFNLRYLVFVPAVAEHGASAGWFLRMPWLLGALWLTVALYRRERLLALALLAAFGVQCFFWMIYESIGFAPTRYLQPLTGLFAVGLLYFGDAITRRWPVRGLNDSATLLLAWNLAFFIRGDETGFPPALRNPAEPHELLCYVWHMQPFPPEQLGGYGTAIGAMQIAVAAVLIVVGVFLLRVAGRRAADRDRLMATPAIEASAWAEAAQLQNEASLPTS